MSLIGGAACAAGGQFLLAVGARERTEIVSFLNHWIAMGLALYGLGTIFWIYSLSKAALVQVYPFTVLTYALIYLCSILFLDERPTLSGTCGVALVLVGLYLLTLK